MAQTTDNADIEAETKKHIAETARLNAKTAEINAKTAEINAQKAFDAANAAPDTRLTDVTSAAALAEAQKNLATAQTSTKIAQQIGQVQSGSYSGAIDLKDKTGTVEARLLAAKAVDGAAERIARSVKEHADATHAIAVIPARSFVSFDTLYLYRLRRGLVERALESVLPPLVATTPASTGAPVAGSAVAIPALVSSGLDALGKVLGFLKTDYQIGGIDVTLDEEIVISAVAGQLLSQKIQKVVLPLTFMPQAQAKALGEITAEMSELLALRTRGVQAASKEKANITTLEASLSAEKDDAKKKILARDVEIAKTKLSDIEAAVALHDEFVGGLVATKEATAPTLRKILSELLIEQLSATHAILLVRLEATGGGYLIKKNMWTGLGSMPLYHMGGSAVSYVLLDPITSNVAAAGTHAVHGGFVKSQDMQAALDKKEKVAGEQ
jgi:hypothetical protein